MNPKKPTWFKFGDLLGFGGPTLLSLIGTIIVFCSDSIVNAATGAPVPTGVFGVHGLMVTLTLTFLAIYLYVIHLRVKDLKPFRYMTGNGYGVMVHSGKYETSFEDDDILGQFEQAFSDWDKIFPGKVYPKVNGKVFWVWFEPAPLHSPRSKLIKVAGYTIAGSAKTTVAYKDPKQPLDRTALQHEIGHMIQGAVTGSWDMAEHHKRSADHKLP